MKTAEPRVFVRPEYSIERRQFGKQPVNRATTDYSMVVVLDGQCRVSTIDKTTDFENGSVILLNPNQLRNLSSSGKSTELLILLLPASYLYQMAGQLQIVSDSELLFRDLSMSADTRVKFLIQTITDELQVSQAGHAVVIDATVSQL